MTIDGQELHEVETEKLFHAFLGNLHLHIRKIENPLTRRYYRDTIIEIAKRAGHELHECDVIEAVPTMNLPPRREASPEISLRDWFAGQIAIGLVYESNWKGMEKFLGEHAYRMADAMLKAREAKDGD